MTNILPSEDEKKVRLALSGSVLALHGADYEYVRRLASLLAEERTRVETRWRTWVEGALVRLKLDLEGELATSAADELELLLARSDDHRRKT